MAVLLIPRPGSGGTFPSRTASSSTVSWLSSRPSWTRIREPESDRVIDFGVDAARDFAPERSQNANVYEAVADHVAELRRASPTSAPQWTTRRQ